MTGRSQDVRAKFGRHAIGFRSPKGRTSAGLAAARASGRAGGRPLRTTAQKVAIARQMYETREHTMAVIPRRLGVSRASVCRYVGLAADDARPAPPPAGLRPLPSFLTKSRRRLCG